MLGEHILAKVPTCQTVFVLNAGASIQTARPTLSLGIEPGAMTDEQKQRVVALVKEQLANQNLSGLEVEIIEGTFWW